MNQVLSRYFFNEKALRLISWLTFCAFVFPFLTASSFTTLDGPGHIHNAKIIRALLTSPESLWSSYFQLNTFVSPNLLGHYVLLAVIQVVGDQLADRVMLVLCMAALFFAMRYMLRALKVDHVLLMLPLCFLLNTPLFSGFFSFTLGLAAMFMATGYFLHHRDVLWLNPIPIRKGIVLALLLVLTYLLHLVPAVLACLFIGIAFWMDVIEKRKDHSWKFRLLWKPFRAIALTLLPVSLLVILYQLHDAETTNYSYIETKELWRQWGVMQGLIINHRHELAFTRWYWIVPSVAIFIELVLLKLKPTVFENRKLHRGSIALLIPMLLSLCGLYFIMPDASSGGGALSVRLNFMLVIFSVLLLFMLLQTQLMRFVALATLVFVLFDHRNKVLAYHDDHAFFMRDLKELDTAFDRPGVLLVHRFRYDWPFEHCTKYLGSHHQIIPVDALGGHKIYAPVMWQPSLRNQGDLVAMLDKGWQQDPRDWLRFFPGEYVYVLTIGSPSAADSTAWSNWQNYMLSQSAVESWSGDSLMHVFAFAP